MRVSLGVLLFAVAGAGLGCERRRELTPEMAEAQANFVFENRCATCHGSDGRGDGPAARALPVRPRDYTDAAWQRATTDAQIRTAIVGGGAALGKSTAMPANKDLDPAVVDALVRKIRAFGR